MPIRPENRGRYPKDWKQIRARILERARDRCENCRVPNKAFRINRGPRRGEWTMDLMQCETWSTCDEVPVPWITRVVLTVAHLDHTPEHCAPENLRAWCQRCHLAYDQAHHQGNAYQSRRKGKALGDLFEEEGRSPEVCGQSPPQGLEVPESRGPGMASP